MDIGTNFLKSKIARRFCVLFILCAFVPTAGLIFLSYHKVVKQLEEQSAVRLTRDAKAYGISLFDRLLRLDNELQALGRGFSNGQGGETQLLEDSQGVLEHLFHGIAIRGGEENYLLVFGTLDSNVIGPMLTKEMLADSKPFIITVPREGSADIYLGCNIERKDGPTISVVALVKQTYLWGVGPEPLLPPMTELSVFDKTGESIMASQNGVRDNYYNLSKQRNFSNSNLRLFQYEYKDQTYLASVSTVFVESRFQNTGWTIILSQNRTDVMAATKNFKTTVPFIILLFLLIILYLSVSFIRKGLKPLEQLKEGTKRIARKEFTTPIDIKSDDEFQELGDAFNDMAAKLDKQFNTLLVLGEIDRAILSSLERNKIVGTTLQRLKDYFGCDMCLFAKNSTSAAGHIKVYTLQGRRINDPQVEYFSLEQGEADQLFADYSHKIFDGRVPLPHFFEKTRERQQTEYLCLPISVDGVINRALILGWSKPPVFNEDLFSQARKIANQLAIAITNSLHLENLEKLATGTIEALARTVDAKSKWTSGHSERVAALGGRIGRALGLDGVAIDTITRGGLLHDIGKIGIPLAILDKPGRLSEQEYAEVKNHPAIGGKILEPISAFQDILPVVVQHHEKFDGTGYPEGLKGDEIDIRARILGVADVWDALVSSRPYREGWIHERARKCIVEESGTHFDPQVVNAFLAVLAEG